MTEGTDRLCAFSDGVFAIACTLLILEIRVPEAGIEGSLWTGLLALWPSYLAFALSFFVILVTWITHHDLIRLVRATDRPARLAKVSGRVRCRTASGIRTCRDSLISPRLRPAR